MIYLVLSILLSLADRNDFISFYFCYFNLSTISSAVSRNVLPYENRHIHTTTRVA